MDINQCSGLFRVDIASGADASEGPWRQDASAESHRPGSLLRLARRWPSCDTGVRPGLEQSSQWMRRAFDLCPLTFPLGLHPAWDDPGICRTLARVVPQHFYMIL